jgi:hypothetical protein
MWLSTIAVLIGAELDSVIECKAAPQTKPLSQ